MAQVSSRDPAYRRASRSTCGGARRRARKHSLNDAAYVSHAGGLVLVLLFAAPLSIIGLYSVSIVARTAAFLIIARLRTTCA